MHLMNLIVGAVMFSRSISDKSDTSASLNFQNTEITKETKVFRKAQQATQVRSYKSGVNGLMTKDLQKQRTGILRQTIS